MARKKAVTPGGPAVPDAKPEVKVPGVPGPAEAAPKRPEPLTRGMGRGVKINDYDEAMAKVRAGEVSVPVLTSKGWIVDKPEA